jgi:hypothetical protein
MTTLETDPSTAEQATQTPGFFESILRSPHSVIQSLRDKRGPSFRTLFLFIAAGLSLFGLLLGTFSMSEQLWAAPLKIVIGMIGCGLVCLPSLIVFGVMSGEKFELVYLLKIFTAMLALASIVLGSFAPILWLFSRSSNSLPFFGFLALVVWICSLIFGSRFLVQGTSSEGKKNQYLLIWLVLFCVVTFQMSTTLRPIIGTSDTFLTNEKRGFVEHWFMALSGRDERQTNKGQP